METTSHTKTRPTVAERLVEERQRVDAFLASPAQKWSLVQEPLDKGIQKGINAADRNYSSQLTLEERNEIYATAVEKAFKGLLVNQWKGKSVLEHWAYRIGYHATVDILRQRNRNPLYQARPLVREDQEHVGGYAPPTPIPSQHVTDPVETPEETIVAEENKQRIAGLREIVDNWTEPERSMGLAILNGEVASLTAAARIVTQQGHKMYLAKARNMLQKRLRGYEDLV